MTDNYWKNFYVNRHTLRPSSFAKFIVKYFRNNNIIFYDLGCGNGRDSYYIGKKFRVIGIDKNIRPADRNMSSFIQCDISNVLCGAYCPDVVYSRFLLHSIPYNLVNDIIKWTKGYFVAQCRSEGDEPVVFRDHDRFFIDGNQLVSDLINNDFNILYYKKDRNLAKYKNENPLIIRIIAKKND
jgi:SAM-dependent methyltransferase